MQFISLSDTLCFFSNTHIYKKKKSSLQMDKNKHNLLFLMVLFFMTCMWMCVWFKSVSCECVSECVRVYACVNMSACVWVGVLSVLHTGPFSHSCTTFTLDHAECKTFLHMRNHNCLFLEMWEILLLAQWILGCWNVGTCTHNMWLSSSQQYQM